MWGLLPNATVFTQFISTIFTNSSRGAQLLCPTFVPNFRGQVGHFYITSRQRSTRHRPRSGSLPSCFRSGLHPLRSSTPTGPRLPCVPATHHELIIMYSFSWPAGLGAGALQPPSSLRPTYTVQRDESTPLPPVPGEARAGHDSCSDPVSVTRCTHACT